MRPIWSGYISFGLVNIPVSLYTAEKRFAMHFHLLDSRDKSRIKYKKVNENTGAEVPWNKIVHGYEINKDDYIIIKDSDLDQVTTTAKTVAIENFIDKEEINSQYFETPYYLVPGPAGMKSYALLREALKLEKKMGIAKVAIRGREHLAAITPLDNVLVLNLLRFRQEIRPTAEFELPDEDTKNYKITDKELELAKQLIQSMSEKWQPENYHDEYREKLMSWIEEKAKGHVTIEKKPQEKNPQPQDLISLMKKSMAEALKKNTANKTAKPRKSKNEPRPI